jgi:hypothetical protein
MEILPEPSRPLDATAWHSSQVDTVIQEHHSPQPSSSGGSQLAGNAYKKQLSDHGLQVSMHNL